MLICLRPHLLALSLDVEHSPDKGGSRLHRLREESLVTAKQVGLSYRTLRTSYSHCIEYTGFDGEPCYLLEELEEGEIPDQEGRP